MSTAEEAAAQPAHVGDSAEGGSLVSRAVGTGRGVARRAGQAGRRAARATSRAVRGRRSHWARTPAHERVQAEVTEFAYDLEAGSGAIAPSWADSARRRADEAQAMLLQGETVEAEALLRAARRQVIHGQGRVEVVMAGHRLLDESADQLTPSIVDRVRNDLVARGDRRPSLPQLRTAVAEATQQADDRQVADSRAHRAAARLVDRIGAALVVLLGITAVGAWLGNLPADEGEVLRNLGNFAGAVGFGAIGAAFSLLLPWWRDDPPPATEYLHGTALLLIRLAVGATAAVMVLLFVQSGVQMAVSATEAQAVTFALLAGFAERLVDRRLAA